MSEDDSDKLVILKGKKQVIGNALEPTTGQDKGILDQLGEVTNALNKVQEFLGNKVIQEGIKRWMQARGIPMQQVDQGFQQAQAMMAPKPQAPEPSTQAPIITKEAMEAIMKEASKNKVEAKSEYHKVLMEVFNTFEEGQVRSFLKQFLGSDDIDRVKAKVEEWRKGQQASNSK